MPVCPCASRPSVAVKLTAGTGLAETLQSEFMLYGIEVHLAMPGTMYTKGYEEENVGKPKITLKLEEADGGATPERVAGVILKGE